MHVPSLRRPAPARRRLVPVARPLRETLADQAKLELRRSRAVTKAGEPCRAWAIWGQPDGLCAAHAGVTGGRRLSRSERRRTLLTTRNCMKLAGLMLGQERVELLRP